MFGYKKGDFPITELISDSTIALPFYNNLEENDVKYRLIRINKIGDKVDFQWEIQAHKKRHERFRYQ